MGRKILIVEDDTAFGAMLRSWSEKNGFIASLTSHTEHAKEVMEREAFDLVITDLRLPDGDGIMLLTWIMERKSPPPVIMMTSYAEVHSAVSAIKLGAFDYLEKPINPHLLKEKIEQALGQQAPEPLVTIGKASLPRKTDEMVYGNSPQAMRMYEHIRIVAPTKLSVLITGESGTGKEYAAHVIHTNSKRSNGPFYAVDCGSLSKELAPSELFGHLKGSFTSAHSNKKGIFEMADGGTVFLDEVGNLGYDVQVQLLRAVQEMKIRPVGAVRDIDIDVRIIVATNEDLLKAIDQGRFREDLYHRLNEFSITVPPLRERVADIPVFAAHFLESANRDLDKDIKGISPEAMNVLVSYHWSGNLRELRNVIRRAALFTQGDTISREALPEYILFPQQPQLTSAMPLRQGSEREQIEAALNRSCGNKTLAAKYLGIDRKTLYNKMHLYDMEL